MSEISCEGAANTLSKVLASTRSYLGEEHTNQEMFLSNNQFIFYHSK